ncbi:acyl-CoA dehydrogenase [Ramlibacter solisilvae]|uniref:Acyl-CoA dehydrogenase n=1 Tax=Ramlibacter tataouinensis TaxID=94132 RepID=A0A127JVT3_9BURK|nr:acyl-CoA dehydrogenase family protein [Ramlibacter tataouinensis]AMO24118.1 acyl-CoA dehydrogenase [Ramlibacter tataouinensis]
MDFKLNSEQQLLQDSVRRYIGKAYAFETRAAAVNARKGASLDHWQAFADNGWLAAALPEAYGGLGGNLVDTALIAQELGRGLVLEPYLGCAVVAAQTLAAGGTTAQKARLLPLLADGSHRIALAYSELASRGTPLPVATIARQVGDGYVLQGRKSLVLSGCMAQQYIVSARIDGAPADQITLFLVDADAAGLVRQALPLHDGTWAEELVLEGVQLTAAAVLGEPGRGLAALQAGLSHGVVALGAELVGAMERVIEATAEYLKTRKQFGVAIGSFQSLQHRIADMAAEMETARSMLFVALDSALNDDAATRQRTLSGAKALIGRAAKFVCGQGIQLHGGIGMTEEYLIGHYFKRAVVAELQLGSIERHEAACMA